MKRNFKNGVITIGIFIAATGGVFAFKNYKSSVKEFKTETVVMAEKVNIEDNKYLKNKDTLTIYKSERVSGNPGRIYGWLDNKKLLATSIEVEGKKNELYIVDSETGERKEIYSHKKFINPVISPDRSKILCNMRMYDDLEDGEEGITKKIIYDIKNHTVNKVENIDSTAFFSLWSNDNSKIIGTDIEKYEQGDKIKFLLYDIQKKENEYIEFDRNENNDYSHRGIFKGFLTNDILRVGKKMFFRAIDYKTESSKVYSIKVDKPNSLEIEIQKDIVIDIQAFDDKKLIYSGIHYSKGHSPIMGLFLFDIETKEIKNLLKGHIGYFYLSEDRTRIAYDTLKGTFQRDKFNSLCAAKIDGYEIIDTMEFYRYLYDESEGYIIRDDKKMFWSEDNKKLLLTRSDEIDKDDYIFYFNMPKR